MKSIVIIFPYFGQLPVQYGMWRASALRNPSVDFMFFTDANIEPAPNIIVHHMQFVRFQELFRNKFDFPIVLDRPYKLCEYKQAYGFVLQDYIRNYDFWGFGDLDLVYGDLRHFITDEALSHKFLLGWGHLSLFHNEEDTNTYFMKKEEGYQYYKDAFSTSRITFFDEFDHKGCSDKWRDYRPDDCWFENPFDNVSKPKQSYHFNSLNHEWQRVLFEHEGCKLYMIRRHNGEWERRETLYAHFQHRQQMRDKVRDYDHFLVTPNVIVDYPRHFTSLWLRYYGRSHNLRTKYYQWRDRIIWKMGWGKQR